MFGHMEKGGEPVVRFEAGQAYAVHAGRKRHKAVVAERSVRVVRMEGYLEGVHLVRTADDATGRSEIVEAGMGMFGKAVCRADEPWTEDCE